MSVFALSYFGFRGQKSVFDKRVGLLEASGPGPGQAGQGRPKGTPRLGVRPYTISPGQGRPGREAGQAARAGTQAGLESLRREKTTPLGARSRIPGWGRQSAAVATSTVEYILQPGGVF